MKLFTTALCAFPLLFLQGGSCAQKKALKQEFSKQEFKTLKSQPNYVKDFIINNYDEQSDLADLSINKSSLDGETVYGIFMKDEFYLIDNTGETISVFDASELGENSELIIGEQLYKAPPPPMPPVMANDEVVESEMPPPPPPPSGGVPDKKPTKGDAGKSPNEELEAAGQDAPSTKGISTCIQEKINGFIAKGSHLSASQVYAYKSEGKIYYMFDHGMAVDGPGYVLNENCDTVCVGGGMRRLNPDAKPCPQEDGGRKVLWVKE